VSDEHQLNLLTQDVAVPAHALWRGAPDTERIAAARVLPFSGRNRCRYALAVVDAGSRGLTDHEAADRCRFPAWTGAGSRRLELVDEDDEPLVRDSGLRRMSPSGRPCAVWVALPALVKLVADHRDELHRKAWA
jgi:hypothetical protein